ncbi:metallophosphoesterase [Chitinophaga costaii]|uniref:metallophosphoesterase n=1 Tax=Chitinophaga costaii TaxID=1335309 RepID=UPI001F0C8C6C|nr:metallophosphoesterase [Chitinophaga costaii]
MRKFIQRLFRAPMIRLADKLSSRPDKAAVFKALSTLYDDIENGKTTRGRIQPFDPDKARYIIFSDEHKGGKDEADDFMPAESNYIAALQHYYAEGFTFINLGDCEELWENKPAVTLDKNKASLDEEVKFLQAGRYHRMFGNHDLEWGYAVPENLYLKPVFGPSLEVKEGLILRATMQQQTASIFLTHGHQGDQRSDGNAFSKWVVAAIWTPIQRYLEISLNTPSDSFELADAHNIIMYEWSATRRNRVLISGHTHKPVFASLDHIDRLNKQLQKAQAENNTTLMAELQIALDTRRKEYAGKQQVKTMAHPSYFNTGCCCFSDGDCTGIEIADGFIRLVKWKDNGHGTERMVLEESPLFYLFDQL